MKKVLFALMMLATLATNQTIVAQSQNPKDAQELVDSANRADALEAYSDTTASNTYDSTVVSRHHRVWGYTNDSQLVNNLFDKIGMEGIMGMGFVLIALMIVFVLAPVLILAVLLFFVYKNRKQKVKMAEMAMKQGQPIPDQLLVEEKETDDQLWQKGLRQTFLGVGLLAFFAYVGSSMGIGIGILVTVIGLGKLAIVKTSRKS